MRFILLIILFLSSSLIGQDASSKIYWNSLATAVNIVVPLEDDKTLKGGRIQIRVSFDQGKTFSDLGSPSPIEKGDIDDLKDISIPGELFEAMKGFKEGGEAHFIAEIWDKAGNSILGEVSDSVLTIDETIPTIGSLTVTSSNSLDPVSYTHLRAHETPEHLVCRLLLEKKKKKKKQKKKKKKLKKKKKMKR